MLSVCLQSENCDTLVVWGVSDRYPWLAELTGSLDDGTWFDIHYQPKPAFDGLVEMLELSE